MTSYLGTRCPVCQKIFTGGVLSVSRHINMVHLKLKPYECGLCGLRFSSSGSRTRHEKKACKSRDEPKQPIVRMRKRGRPEFFYSDYRK